MMALIKFLFILTCALLFNACANYSATTKGYTVYQDDKTNGTATMAVSRDLESDGYYNDQVKRPVSPPDFIYNVHTGVNH
jgi:PBP1b-binding outer membrane lipoprotein LpoB